MTEQIKEKQPEKEKPMSEQMLLDAMEQLKEKFDVNEYLVKNMEKRVVQLKKELFSAYGMIRVLDNLINNSYGIENEIECLSDSIRGHLSSVIEDII